MEKGCIWIKKSPFHKGKGFDLVPKIFAVLQQFHRLLSDYPLFISWVSISIASANRDLDKNHLKTKLRSAYFG